MVRLDFSVELDYQVQQPTEFALMLHVPQTPCQKVLTSAMQVTPDTPVALSRCAAYGNWHALLHAEPGSLKIQYSAMVELTHHFAEPGSLREVPIREMPLEVRLYLNPSRYCPSDLFTQLAAREFGRMAPGYARVQAISAWV